MVLLVAILAAASAYLYSQLESEHDQNNSPPAVTNPSPPAPTPSTPPVPTPPTPQPPAPTYPALLCWVNGWNDSLFNANSTIRDSSDGGVILNRQATVGAIYSATGAASVDISCNRPFTLQRSSDQAYWVDSVPISGASVRISPQRSPSRYRVILRIVSNDALSYQDDRRDSVDLEVYVHDGGDYFHFVPSNEGSISIGDTEVYSLRNPRERLASYRVDVPAGATRTRSMVCASLTSDVDINGCYVVHSRTFDNSAGPQTATPEVFTSGYVSLLTRRRGEVFEASPYAVVYFSGYGYLYQGVSAASSSGSVSIADFSSQGCVRFLSDNLRLDDSVARQHYVRWCLDSNNRTFNLDSIVPVTPSAVSDPNVLVAVIQAVSEWGNSRPNDVDVPRETDGGNDPSILYALPQRYTLGSFRHVASGANIPVGPISNTYGVAVVCTARTAPTLAPGARYFYLDRAESSVGLPGFYWLFFSGDVANTSQNSTTLRCGNLSVPVLAVRGG